MGNAACAHLAPSTGAGHAVIVRAVGYVGPVRRRLGSRSMSPPTARVRTGLEAALDDPHPILRDAAAFGLVCNQASVTGDFAHAPDALLERFPDTLRALFGPQHGLWSTEQDNMIETTHGSYRGLPVWSLYSETRRPTAQMLDGLDLLVVDLQDVGTRVYTYAWTLVHCMQACAAADIPVLVLDRPNPLGGMIAEGALLDPAFTSFVGLAEVPMRHGLTLGELGRYCNRTLAIGCDLHVQTMRGWTRTMLWSDTGLAWVPPSPNLPRFDGVLTYPGQVLLEGTNLSEGRGTTTPFEQFGAPFIDPERLRAWLDEHGGVPGATLRPVAFEPTFQKWQGQQCRGLFVHVVDPATLRSYRMTVLILRAMRELWPDQFAWNRPPYEYEERLWPIDILTGGDAVRAFVDERLGDPDALTGEPADWWQRATGDLLYER